MWISLVLFASFLASTALQDGSRLRSNATLNLAKPATLDTRDFFGLVDRASSYYTCAIGNDYCADPGDICCTVGTCPSGWNCCGNAGMCSPKNGECCSDGSYCDAGDHCRIWRGREVCCPTSGCVGENDSGDLGNTVTVAASMTETATMFTTVAPSYTHSYTYYDYEYYYTTIYWTYWFYYWTSYSPYTVKTVTSTQTTTTTIWSAYETNSAEASSSFAAKSESYTFSAPYYATSLKASTDPVKLASNGFSTPTSTSSSGQGSSLTVGDSATGVSTNSFAVVAGAGFVALIAALAFGL
ncbi:hypothetical protein N7448_004796 [Penicillium atrosanguineum]|uniref:GPI anchored protein n=1 Tax=Penicillium atrosanguineum TaxID=1132637 RepID=A0A9W9PR31_9EURO|nr:uncharacterized protein N7443_008546 [Penicillium atrosanguineum]KAJ5125476.1 hypothetical protein N7526_007653 [Penicillium atrosanguineum]KAJ5136242.1 hypothetical protein N7448_004796 [Penicillium atrosanguineum]KAJ5292593.1 hypothetical protein N7443_008546 [Penicillium atrosanguineum]KAJ5303383.1 hypothetical protein N7476_010182 [Penicillium atrosanguineum]